MINKYLKQIIDLDKNIQQQRKNVAEEINELNSETDQKILQIEDQILTQNTRIYQNRYDQKIKEAQKIRNEEILKAENKCFAMRESYKKGKEEAVNIVINSILESFK